MSRSFACVNCRKRFSTSKALSCHISNKHQCRRKWHQFLANLTPRPPSPLVYPTDLPEVASLPLNNVGIDNGAPDDIDDDDSLADISEEEGMIPVPPKVLDIAAEPMDWTLEHSIDSVNQSTPVPSILPGVGTTAEPSLPSTYEDVFPGAGSVISTGEPPFAMSAMEQDRKNKNRYYPFSGPDDWELAVWLHESKLSMSQIDKFLHLNYVCAAHSAFTLPLTRKVRFDPIPIHHRFAQRLLYTTRLRISTTLGPDGMLKPSFHPKELPPNPSSSFTVIHSRVLNIFCHVPHWRSTWYLLQGNCTRTKVRLIGYFRRCALATGGGGSRYVISCVRMAPNLPNIVRNWLLLGQPLSPSSLATTRLVLPTFLGARKHGPL